MKRKSTALLLSLLLLLALCVPALAAIEYGVFYDETDLFFIIFSPFLLYKFHLHLILHHHSATSFLMTTLY